MKTIRNILAGAMLVACMGFAQAEEVTIEDWIDQVAIQEAKLFQSTEPIKTNIMAMLKRLAHSYQCTVEDVAVAVTWANIDLLKDQYGIKQSYRKTMQDLIQHGTNGEGSGVLKMHLMLYAEHRFEGKLP